MNYFFSGVLLIQAVISSYWGISKLFANKEIKLRFSLCLIGIFSSIWSLGFGVLYSVKNVTYAYDCRCFGMIGVVGYFIFFIYVFGTLSKIKPIIRYPLASLSLLGIPLYFALIHPSAANFFLKDGLMQYTLNKGIVNNLYSVYSVMLALVELIFILILMKSATSNREKRLAKIFMVALIVMVVGLLLDTIFPMFGMAAWPGTSIMQFWAYALIIFGLKEGEYAETTVMNMSKYVYSSLTLPVCIYDCNKEIKLANSSAEKFFRKSQKKLVEEKITLKQLFDVDGDTDFFDFEESYRKFTANCLVNGAICDIRIEIIRDRYQDIIGYLVIIYDITQQTQMMKKLEAANNIKNIFLANMSHEIRTPMNAIMGFSEILLKEDIPVDQKSYVEGIRDSSTSLLSIVNDILDVSMIEEGKVEIAERQYNPMKILHNIELQYRPIIEEKKLELRMNIDPNIPRGLCGDDARIQIILSNLVNNAVKYTDAGHIDIRATKEFVNDKVNLILVVKDTGIGIKPEDKAVIFDTFEQANRHLHKGLEGTGLGLAIVKGYLKIMGGWINLESTIGEGAEFTVTIPQKIVDSQPMGVYGEAVHEVRSSIGNLHLEGSKVLVVDDNKVNLKVVSRALSCYGITAKTVLSGQESIEACRQVDYDIVFMDQMMPVMDGVEAMQHIRKLSSHYEKGGPGKIVALTANAIKGVREEMLDAGFDEYIKKPMEFPILEDVLRRNILEKNDNSLGENRAEERQSRNKEENTMGQVNIPGIVYEDGLEHCGGDPEIYLDILDTVIEEGEEYLGTMKDHIENDMDTYIIEIHGCKGMCYNVGANHCGDFAKSLELAGKGGDFDFIKNNQASFEEEFKTLLADIDKYLNDCGFRG